MAYPVIQTIVADLDDDFSHVFISFEHQDRSDGVGGYIHDPGRL
jgi:hypothetical protein